MEINPKKIEAYIAKYIIYNDIAEQEGSAYKIIKNLSSDNSVKILEIDNNSFKDNAIEPNIKQPNMPQINISVPEKIISGSKNDSIQSGFKTDNIEPIINKLIDNQLSSYKILFGGEINKCKTDTFNHVKNEIEKLHDKTIEDRNQIININLKDLSNKITEFIENDFINFKKKNKTNINELEGNVYEKIIENKRNYYSFKEEYNDQIDSLLFEINKIKDILDKKVKMIHDFQSFLDTNTINLDYMQNTEMPEYKKELEKNRKNISEIKTLIDSMEKEINIKHLNLNTSIINLEQDYRSLKDLLQTLNDGILNTNKDGKELDLDKIILLDTEIKNIYKTLEHVQVYSFENIEKCHQLILDLEQNIDFIKTESKQFEIIAQEINNFKHNFNNLKNNLDIKIQFLDTNMAEVKTSITELIKGIEVVQKIDEKVNKIDTKIKNYQSYTDSVDEIVEKQKKLLNYNTNNDTQIDEIKEDIKKINNSIDNITQKGSLFENNIENEKNKIDTFISKIDYNIASEWEKVNNLSREILKLDETLTENKNQIEEISKTAEDITKKTDSINNNLIEESNKFGTINKKFVKIDKEFVSVENKLKQEDDKINDLITKTDSSLSTLNEGKANLTELNNDIRKIANLISNINSQLKLFENLPEKINQFETINGSLKTFVNLEEKARYFKSVQEILENFNSLEEKVNSFISINNNLEIFNSLEERKEYFNSVKEKLKDFNSLEDNINKFKSIQTEILKFDSLEEKNKRFNFVKENITILDSLEDKIARFNFIKSNINKFDSLEDKTEHFATIKQKLNNFNTIDKNVTDFEKIKTDLLKFKELDIKITDFDNIKTDLLKFGKLDDKISEFTLISSKIDSLKTNSDIEESILKKLKQNLENINNNIKEKSDNILSLENRIIKFKKTIDESEGLFNTIGERVSKLLIKIENEENKKPEDKNQQEVYDENGIKIKTLIELNKFYDALNEDFLNLKKNVGDNILLNRSEYKIVKWTIPNLTKEKDRFVLSDKFDSYIKINELDICKDFYKTKHIKKIFFHLLFKDQNSKVIHFDLVFPNPITLQLVKKNEETIELAKITNSIFTYKTETLSNIQVHDDFHKRVRFSELDLKTIFTNSRGKNLIPSGANKITINLAILLEVTFNI